MGKSMSSDMAELREHLKSALAILNKYFPADDADDEDEGELVHKVKAWEKDHPQVEAEEPTKPKKGLLSRLWNMLIAIIIILLIVLGMLELFN